jgi:hypothetical protein
VSASSHIDDGGCDKRITCIIVGEHYQCIRGSQQVHR